MYGEVSLLYDRGSRVAFKVGVGNIIEFPFFTNRGAFKYTCEMCKGYAPVTASLHTSISTVDCSQPMHRCSQPLPLACV